MICFKEGARHGWGQGIQVLEEVLGRAVTDVAAELEARVQEGVGLFFSQPLGPAPALTERPEASASCSPRPELRT